MACAFKAEKFRGGEYQCDRIEVPKSQYCIFHDENKWQTDPDYQIKLDDEIKRLSDSSNHDFLGFHFP